MNFDLYSGNSSTLPSLRMATSAPISPVSLVSSAPVQCPPTSASPCPSSALSCSSPSEMKNTLWMGDLDPWMDESLVKQCWQSFGEQVNVKMIRDKFTGMNAGYCFVEFESHPVATQCLVNFNGVPIPGTSKVFKLNWASGGGLVDRKDQQGPEYSIFVGDLGPEVGDSLLMSTFLQRYPSCKTAKVVTDAVTGLSRGYGFVRFTEESDQQRAMLEMQGQYCGSRPMRISVATPKNRFGNYAQWSPVLQSNWSLNMLDPSNTTVFVGGLTNNFVTEEDLGGYFAPFGPITYVKIPPGKGCGFVSFVHRQSAELAIANLNGCVICGNRVRLSWGRNTASAPTSPSICAPATPGASWKQFSPATCFANYSPMLSPEKHIPPPPEMGSFPYQIQLQQHQQQQQLNGGRGNNNSMFSYDLASNNSPPSLVDIDPYPWKADTSFDSLSRPSSVLGTSTLFHQFGGHQSRNAGVVRFPSSAPFSPDLLLRSAATPSPIMHGNSPFHNNHNNLRQRSESHLLLQNNQNHGQPLHEQQQQQEGQQNNNNSANSAASNNNSSESHVAYSVASSGYGEVWG